MDINEEDLEHFNWNYSARFIGQDVKNEWRCTDFIAITKSASNATKGGARLTY